MTLPDPVKFEVSAMYCRLLQLKSFTLGFAHESRHTAGIQESRA